MVVNRASLSCPNSPGLTTTLTRFPGLKPSSSNAVGVLARTSCTVSRRRGGGGMICGFPIKGVCYIPRNFERFRARCMVGHHNLTGWCRFRQKARESKPDKKLRGMSRQPHWLCVSPAHSSSTIPCSIPRSHRCANVHSRQGRASRTRLAERSGT